MCSGGRAALCICLICHENKCADDNNGQLCFHVLARAEWGQPNPAKSGDGGELTQAEDVSDNIFSLRGRKHEHWHPSVRRC
jgi:hypothetical protein